MAFVPLSMSACGDVMSVSSSSSLRPEQSIMMGSKAQIGAASVPRAAARVIKTANLVAHSSRVKP